VKGINLFFDNVYYKNKYQRKLMAIKYENLDQTVRQHMLDELESDIRSNNYYKSKRLRVGMENEWLDIFKKAVELHNDAWLESQIRILKILVEREEQSRNGKIIEKDVPHDAAETLATGEFNRLYMRGICLDVISSSKNEVEVYRGKSVAHARSESQQLIGKKLKADLLLKELRDFNKNIGVDAALGLPPGPNSGISIKKI
jgi:hypothetical protein